MHTLFFIHLKCIYTLQFAHFSQKIGELIKNMQKICKKLLHFFEKGFIIFTMKVLILLKWRNCYEKNSKLTALISALVMAVFCFAACGSAPETNPEDSAAPSASADASTSEGGMIAKIKEKGKLTVLTEAGFAPFEYIDTNNNIVGLDVEILRRLRISSALSSIWYLWTLTVLSLRFSPARAISLRQVLPLMRKEQSPLTSQLTILTPAFISSLRTETTP